MDSDAPSLTAGIEIHQQLDTRKLFCNCPSGLSDDPAFDRQFTRRRRNHHGLFKRGYHWRTV